MCLCSNRDPPSSWNTCTAGSWSPLSSFVASLFFSSSSVRYPGEVRLLGNDLVWYNCVYTAELVAFGVLLESVLLLLFVDIDYTFLFFVP